MGTKRIAALAIVVSVLGLSLGFAAFSNTLTIKSEALVQPNENLFNIDFVGDSGGSVAPVIDNTVPGATATNATIGSDANGNSVIENIKATFTEPGQSVSYTFSTSNNGSFKAYLKSISFSNATGGDSFKLCSKVTEGKEASEYATDALVAAACNGINLTLRLGSENFTDDAVRTGFAVPTAHDLDVSASEQIVVTITYAANSARADGEFTVKFGDITLLYSSVEN